MGLTDLALFCLALNVHYEAATEPFEGQVAVAQVTLTRARLSGKDVCEVVYAPWQFSWTMQDYVTPPTHGDLKWALSVAKAAQEAPDLTGGATHFHADYVHPYWADILEKTVTIGRHIFYREESWYNRNANRVPE